MSFLSCANEDPFVTKVRQVYRANVVLAPKAGLGPLEVVARRPPKVENRGKLQFILREPTTYEGPPESNEPAAEISGELSTNVNLSLGAKLTTNFLRAMGVPSPGAELNAKIWSGASRFTFQVRDVRSRRVDVGQLGLTLIDRKIDWTHPAVKIFLDSFAETEMFLVTRVLETPHIAVQAVSSAGSEIEAKLDGLEDILGGATAEISATRESESTVSLRGSRAVTFAGAAVVCNLAPDGSIGLGFEDGNLAFLDSPGKSESPVVDEDGILDFSGDADSDSYLE